MQTTSVKYNVFIMGLDKPIVLKEEAGKKLSTYLTNDPSAFVTLKNINNEEITVRTTTIDRVEKKAQSNAPQKTPKELGMPDLASEFYDRLPQRTERYL